MQQRAARPGRVDHPPAHRRVAVSPRRRSPPRARATSSSRSPASRTRRRSTASKSREARLPPGARRRRPTNEVVGRRRQVDSGADARLPASSRRRPPSRRTRATSPRSRRSCRREFDTFDCTANATKTPSSAPTDQPLITCDDQNQVKYILGPVEVKGQDITDATRRPRARARRAPRTGQWAVNIVFNDEGTKEFADVTTRLVALQGAQNQFAIVLDGKVISAPTTQRGDHRRQAADHRQLHRDHVEDPGRPAEVRRAADQLQGAEPGHHLGDARYDSAAQRPDRRPHRPASWSCIYSFFQYRAARLRHDRLARGRRCAHLPDDLAACPGARTTGSRSPVSRV